MKNGETALSWAVHDGHTAIAALLRAAGAVEPDAEAES